MDAIDASAALIRLYRIDAVRFGARELARDHHARRPMQVRLALEALEQHDGRHRRTPSRSTASRTRPTASTSEARQPAVRRRAATRSPSSSGRRSLDFLEEATDRCEDVANVLEGVVVKHG